MSNGSVSLDGTDWAILRELQADARLSYNELSRRVHLSAPSVAERVRRLEEAQVISGYHAHVDPARVGRQVQAVVRVGCYGPRCLLNETDWSAWPEIREVHRATGDACCILKVAAGSVAELEAFLDRLAPYGPPSSSLLLASPLPWRPLG